MPYSPSLRKQDKAAMDIAAKEYRKATEAYHDVSKDVLHRMLMNIFPDAVRVECATTKYDNGYFLEIESVIRSDGDRHITVHDGMPYEVIAAQCEDELRELLADLTDRMDGRGEHSLVSIDLVQSTETRR